MQQRGFAGSVRTDHRQRRFLLESIDQRMYPIARVYRLREPVLHLIGPDKPRRKRIERVARNDVQPHHGYDRPAGARPAADVPSSWSTAAVTTAMRDVSKPGTASLVN